VVAALETYLEAGRTGRPWPREEFLARHAEIAEALNECLSGLEFIQSAAARLAGQPAAATDRSDEIPPRAQLGDYRILREVGRGGMGVVYEAEQVSLGRRVALKVLPVAAAIDPKQRQRFQIEAQAAAQLQHPHIVPIFNVGCDQGVHYYAMQFVEGRSLAAILHELRHGNEYAAGETGPAALRTLEETDADPPSVAGTSAASSPATKDQRESERPGYTISSPETASASPPSGSDSNSSLAPTAVGPMHPDRAFCCNIARLGAEAADALDHAHGLGILHRDIKPANLLIDPQGALWITDFGLARFPSDPSVTRTGDVVGTLRYMSPEQALARRGVVDQRTDIYSLGVTLYELLTLRPAFDGRDHHELLRQIALDEPAPPRRINKAVPRDLETIVLKAMAKEPAQRYATAQELAADLTRFLEDRPIQARRPGPMERVLRWTIRHREIVGTAAAVLVVALAVGTAAILAQARKKNADILAQAKQTQAALDKYERFIIQSSPLIHRLLTEAIENGTLLQFPGSASGQDASRILEQALGFFQQATELPPKDLESRLVIARAHSRKAFSYWMLSLANGNQAGPEPKLLAQALADFRQSSELLENLIAESPGDSRIRRYLAEALGLGGMGCALRSAFRPDEAEPLYRRSIEIRRDLLCSANPTGGGVQARSDVAGESYDLSLMVSTAHLVAGMLDAKGQTADAEGVRRKLKDDIVAIAARYSKPEFKSRRQAWAGQLTAAPYGMFDRGGRRDAMMRYERALVLDPENALAQNNLAWALTSISDDPWFDPKQGLALARKAVARAPDESTFLNTLGVAAFRSRDWETAAKVLRESMIFSGGAPHDLFFLAMTYYHQGNEKEAREIYDRAVAWTEKHKANDPELGRFRAEATALLSKPCPKPKPETQAAQRSPSA
jgi:serine/threonine protein kinase